MFTNIGTLITMLALFGGEGALSAPIFQDNTTPSASGITTSQLLAIMPSSATCDAALVECRTAEQAAPFINAAFSTYAVTSKAEQAAILGMMAFESVELKYNTNQQGDIGRGTRNMQSGAFNLLYAQSIPALAPQLAATGRTDLNAVRALVLPDAYSFASGAWFMATQCSADVRAAVQTGGEAGWGRFVTECVGTDATLLRRQYWQAALNALG